MVLASKDRRTLVRAKEGFYASNKLSVRLLLSDQLFLEAIDGIADLALGRRPANSHEEIFLRSCLRCNCRRQPEPGLSISEDLHEVRSGVH